MTLPFECVIFFKDYITVFFFFFLRIAINKAFFPCKLLCLGAVNLPIKHANGKHNLKEIVSDKR